MPRTRNPLSPKEELFIDFYTRHGSPSFFNGTQSAINAGYSENSAAVIASELLIKPNIVKEINKRIKNLKSYIMDKEEILYRLSAMARGDLGQFIEVDSLKDLKDQELSFLVKEVERIETTDKKGNAVITFRLKLHDSQSALRDLAKVNKLLDDWEGKLNVDYNKLTDDQLKRLADGERLVDVLLLSNK